MKFTLEETKPVHLYLEKTSDGVLLRAGPYGILKILETGEVELIVNGFNLASLGFKVDSGEKVRVV